MILQIEEIQDRTENVLRESLEGFLISSYPPSAFQIPLSPPGRSRARGRPVGGGDWTSLARTPLLMYAPTVCPGVNYD